MPPKKKTKKSTKRRAGRTKRRKNPYKQQECPGSFGQVCTKVNTWGKAWTKWGDDVLSEIDDLKKRLASTQPTGPGPGPTDATQPPPSPFKK